MRGQIVSRLFAQRAKLSYCRAMDKGPDLSPPERKRGRKPNGDRPMTSRERREASRARMVAVGDVEFTVRASGKTLAIINAMASETENSRAVVVQTLLDYAIAKLDIATQVGNVLAETNASPELIERTMSDMLSHHLPMEVE